MSRNFSLLFFPCSLVYFFLTFVCPFCVFYHVPLVFLYTLLGFLPLGKGRKFFFFGFCFQLQGKAAICIDWGQFLALLSNSIFPVRQDFDKYLFTFCFWSIAIFSNQDCYLHFLFRLIRRAILKICVVSVDIVPCPLPPPPPYLRNGHSKYYRQTNHVFSSNFAKGVRWLLIALHRSSIKAGETKSCSLWRGENQVWKCGSSVFFLVIL